MEWWQPVAIALGGALGFAAFWCLVVFLISRVSGWARLARAYPLREPFAGPVLSFQTGTLGSARYKNALVLGADSHGLYVATVGVFRPGHEPLSIPWSALRSVAHKRFLRWDMAELQLPEGVLRIPWACVERWRDRIPLEVPGL